MRIRNQSSRLTLAFLQVRCQWVSPYIRSHESDVLTGRPGNDMDMAACILYLAGPGGVFLNGQIIFTDGGESLDIVLRLIPGPRLNGRLIRDDFGKPRVHLINQHLGSLSMMYTDQARYDSLIIEPTYCRRAGRSLVRDSWRSA